MRVLSNRLKKTFLSRKGESVMEAVVSLLILGLLMTTVLSIIRFSLVMTGDSLNRARENQNEINNLIRGNYPVSTTAALTFSSVGGAAVTPDGIISATHDIVINIQGADAQNVVAFIPPP